MTSMHDPLDSLDGEVYKMGFGGSDLEGEDDEGTMHYTNEAARAREQARINEA